MTVAAPSEDVCVATAGDIASRWMADRHNLLADLAVRESERLDIPAADAYDMVRDQLEAQSMPAKGGYQLMTHRAGKAVNAQFGCDIVVGPDPRAP